MKRRSLMVGLMLGVSLTAMACNDETAPQRLGRELTYSLQSPTTAEIGDSVVFQLNIQNTAPDSVFVTTGCGPALDLMIRAQDGTAVWDPVTGQVINSCLSERGLARGATMTLQLVWHLQGYNGQTVPPGTYLVSGTFGISASPGGGGASLPVSAPHSLVVTQ